MQIDISNNYFKLFDMHQSMQLNSELLDERYKSLQRESHPDKFASGSEGQKRWAIQATSYINEARSTLLDPLRRAIYLLNLEGIDLNVETDTQMSPEFLMDQIQLREELQSIRSQADPFAALSRLSTRIKAEIEAIKADFEASFLQEQYTECRLKAREWQFIDKIKKELQDIEISIENELD